MNTTTDLTTPKILPEPGFTVPHPAGELLGEELLMCEECGGIEHHTKRCSASRFADAKPVEPVLRLLGDHDSR